MEDTDRPVDRYLAASVKEDLSRKMVFVGGPRQVGKTTFALTFLREGHKRHPTYLDWDFPEHRRSVLRAELPPGEPLVVRTVWRTRGARRSSSQG